MAVLRSLSNEVFVQSGAKKAVKAARNAAGLARRIAEQCLASDRPARAFEALELGRALVLNAAATSRSVSDLLRSAGLAELAAEWEACPPPYGVPSADSSDAVAHIAGSMISAPSELRSRVLAALSWFICSAATTVFQGGC